MGGAAPETLTELQKAQVKAILSKYNASTLTAEQAKAIHEAFRQAGLRGGPSVNEAVKEAGIDPDKLLANVANLITEQFNYYYAAIYLLDPSDKWAELKEATGQAGNVLKQNRYRLEISGRSMVATCIRERTPRSACTEHC